MEDIISVSSHIFINKIIYSAVVWMVNQLSMKVKDSSLQRWFYPVKPFIDL